MKLEKRQYILIGVALLVILFLWTWESDSNNTQEQFTVIPEWPFMPPKYWKNRDKNHWKPWYFYDNNTEHPAVPSISNYDTEFYRFPDTHCLRHEKPKKMRMLPNYKCHGPVQMQPHVQEEPIITPQAPKIRGCNTCGAGNIEYFNAHAEADIDADAEAEIEDDNRSKCQGCGFNRENGPGRVLVEDLNEGFSEELNKYNPVLLVKRRSNTQKFLILAIIGIAIYFFVIKRQHNQDGQ